MKPTDWISLTEGSRLLSPWQLSGLSFCPSLLFPQQGHRQRLQVRAGEIWISRFVNNVQSSYGLCLCHLGIDQLQSHWIPIKCMWSNWISRETTGLIYRHCEQITSQGPPDSRSRACWEATDLPAVLTTVQMPIAKQKLSPPRRNGILWSLSSRT